MDVKIVALPSDQITDNATFHAVFKEAFGFFDGYGRNMNAWIDCMGCLDDAKSGMTRVTVAKGGLVVIRVENAEAFEKRCPDEYNDLLQCSAFVNHQLR